MEDVKKSLKLFDEGSNCAQAILGAYSYRVGLDSSIAFKVGSGLGGGLGRTQHICGAVNAAAIIIGLKYGNGNPLDVESKERASAKVGEFISECNQILGGVECKDLLGINLSNPEVRKAAKENGIFKRVCNNAVEQTAILLEKYLK